MPYAFELPTTSSFSFSTYLESPTHPSLPISTSNKRASVRSALKSHKRLPKSQQAANLPHLLQTIDDYVAYLLALDAGLGSSTNVDVILRSSPRFSWRATISASAIPGREPARVPLSSLEYEIYFVLATQSYIHTLLARSLLAPLNTISGSAPGPEARTHAITTATKHLLSSASIHAYLTARAERLALTTPTAPPAVDIAPSTLRALAALAHGEATLLAVAKDDPYPAAAAQTASESDKEWMIRAPTISKVRAHLNARLCLAGAAHAGMARDLLKGDGGGRGGGKVDEKLITYCSELYRVGRARACRFIAIDKDAAGQTGEAIAWLRAALKELGLRSAFEDSKAESKSRFGVSRLKSSLKSQALSKADDSDIADETRVLRALDAKWTTENDTINTQTVPDHVPLLAQLPSGREIYAVKEYEPPVIEQSLLSQLRGPADGEEVDDERESDSEDEVEKVVVGAFPGAAGGSNNAYY